MPSRILLVMCMVLIARCAMAQPALPDLSGKRVLVVIPPKDFVGVQVKCLVVHFKKTGAEVDIAAPNRDTIHAENPHRRDFGRVTPALALLDVDVRMYDAVVFCSGKSMVDYLDDYQYVDVARNAKEAGCIVGAIGISTAVLAHAQIVDGRKVTGDPSLRSLLEGAGATYLESAVVLDDAEIVTVRLRRAGRKFAGRMVKVLARRE